MVVEEETADKRERGKGREMASGGELRTGDTEEPWLAGKEMGYLSKACGWHRQPRKDPGLLENKVARRSPRQRVLGRRTEGEHCVGPSSPPGT